MAKLVPLNNIPYRARELEARERAKWPLRGMALDAATYAIIDAPGTYSGAFPAVRGWVLTRDAAEAISEERCPMPGGSSHRLWDWQENISTSDALAAYIEAIARGTNRDEAVAAYRAANA